MCSVTVASLCQPCELGPDLLDQLGAGEDLTGMGDEEGEQVELARRERHRPAVELDLARPRVHPQARWLGASAGAVGGIGWPLVRRSTERTRAASSPGEKGLTR